MLKNLLNIVIITAVITINSSIACPVCAGETHMKQAPFFADNNNQTANNARIDKIRQILEAMKSEQ